MNIDIVFGIFAIGFALLTLVLRFTDPGKLGKLEAMQERWGETVGTAIHWIAYTIVPLVAGLVFLMKGLAR
jgi:hypothetical protein